MTKAFLEPMIIKTESEKLIIGAFSQKSLKKIEIYSSNTRISLKKIHKRVLSVNDIFQ